jgi:hypothetical protein
MSLNMPANLEKAFVLFIVEYFSQHWPSLAQDILSKLYEYRYYFLSFFEYQFEKIIRKKVINFLSKIAIHHLIFRFPFQVRIILIN